MSERLELRPIGVRQACETVKLLHRHLPRVVGGLFGAAVYANGELVGVAVASQPKARLGRDGFTVEIARVATDGHRNACSMLYGALCRAAAAVGYRTAVTFTRLDEPGTSLRASGFAECGLTREQSWDRPRRPRDGGPSQVRKWRRSLV
jgi:L-amino acid N-acyltransferase YncA